MTGLVTYDGRPLSDAAVLFTPLAGRPACGVTDIDGRFQLSTFHDGDGALAGKHSVTITANASYVPSFWPDPPKPPPTGPKIPIRYASPGLSGLDAQVVAGDQNDFTFQLTK